MADFVKASAVHVEEENGNDIISPLFGFFVVWLTVGFVCLGFLL